MQSELQRKMGLPLWQLQQRRDDVKCFVEWTPYGPEARYVLNGQVLISRRFETLAEVLDWATIKRDELESEGWSEVYAVA